MQLKLKGFLIPFVLLSFWFSEVGFKDATFAQESEAVAMCKALAPSETQDVSESFKGKVEGKLDGLLSRLAGGVAAIEGEYDKLVKDTLKDYPESQKLYVWQRLIYLACVNNDAKIDFNELAKAYLVGPTGLDLSIKTKDSDLKIEFLGFDTVASSETGGYYNVPNFYRARFPDLVFLFTNVTDKEIHVQPGECSLIDFKLPQPISVETLLSGQRSDDIRAITGTTIIEPVGSNSVIVPAGQKRTSSYGIINVDAPSFEARRQDKSNCRFHIGNGTIFRPKEVEITSGGRYISQ